MFITCLHVYAINFLETDVGFGAKNGVNNSNACTILFMLATRNHFTVDVVPVFMCHSCVRCAFLSVAIIFSAGIDWISNGLFGTWNLKELDHIAKVSGQFQKQPAIISGGRELWKFLSVCELHDWNQALLHYSICFRVYALFFSVMLAAHLWFT